MDSSNARKLPIILLAAGRSRRMRGGDKLLEPVDGVPLLRRQARVARAATQGPVVVTLPQGADARAAALAGLNVTPVPVPDAQFAMSASLRAALAALPPGVPAAMILLADMPDIEASDVRRVCDAVAAKPDARIWRAATKDGRPGHPLVIAADLFPDFASLTGDTGGRGVLAAYEAQTVLVPLSDNRALCDLDTPEDWAAWRARRGG